MKRFFLAAVAALLFSSSAHAADIASDVRAGSGSLDNSDGGYFELGVNLSLNAHREGARMNSGILLAGAYRYRGLFFEALNPGVSLPSGQIAGITLGFNLWRNNRWAVDLLGASTTQRGTVGKTLEVENFDSTDVERENDVIERSNFYNGAGVRLTGYFGNTLFQYRLVNDIHGGNGVTSSARIAYSRLVRNWNFHSVISANYVSQETGQYWYGISDEEASTRFEQYDVDSSTIAYSAEFGVTYPLRESVVFRSTARYTQFADEVAKSPLQESEFGLHWRTSLSYVF